MVRVNISIPEDTLKKVDKYKQLTSLTRSGLIRKAIEKYFIELESKILEERKKLLKI
jgi:metal-responsive CopG/Arc/MetJ family transcriptional regulator